MISDVFLDRSFITRIPNLQPSRPMNTTLHPTFKIFSSSFDVDCEEVPLQLQMELIDLLYSKDLKFKFLAYHILVFYKNHVLLFGWFPNLITPTQQVVSMFYTAYSCEQLFTKIKHAKSMLCSELSNHHLSDVYLLSTSSFNLDIASFCICKQYQVSHY